jgi:DNA-binding transcriptional MocR family regulator
MIGSENRFDRLRLTPCSHGRGAGNQGECAGRVIYVGSFSKVLLLSLRRGFLIAPGSLQPALLAAKQLTDLNSDNNGRSCAIY